MGKIFIQPRLHLTLLDMGIGYRKNGGIGVTISNPQCTLSFEASDQMQINDQRSICYSIEENNKLNSFLEAKRIELNLRHGVSITLEGSMFSHYGFGSGTAIRLGALESMLHVNQRNLTNEEFIKYSGRGGTSGVGIHTYFSGGGVFDLGVLMNTANHQPSSEVQSVKMPLLLDQFVLPEWSVGICIPKKTLPLNVNQEIDFFKRTCPLPAQEIHATVYEALFGLYGSLREGNWLNFCESIKRVQHCAWKRAEWFEYGDLLKDIESKLYLSGAQAVGMSSLGPSLYFMAKDIEPVISLASSLLGEDAIFHKASFTNTGRTLLSD